VQVRPAVFDSHFYSHARSVFMRGFLSEFLSGSPEAAYIVIVMDEGYMEQPRRYHVRPFRLLMGMLASLLGVALVAAAVVTFTPLRQLIPGYGTAQVERNARQNARRAAALEDSLRRQSRYLRHLQNLMAGPVDSSFVAEAQEESVEEAAAPPPRPDESTGVFSSPVSSAGDSLGTEGDRNATAGGGRASFAAARLPDGVSVDAETAAGRASWASSRLDPLPFPVHPPVEGFATRGFDATTGHYAVDIAAEAGTSVRSIGDGYVVMADRTQEGGWAIAVQHAGGYLSLYKHNRRLLKQVGDRVEAREVIAKSGNSGEITTGPHLHVELWHDGLAQDPAAYFIEGS
jgi:murein DD-endopeptidase MepM/ murein hydrolase activator NlpD